MSMIAIALAVAQAASPPSAGIQDEQQLSGLPCFENRGVKHCVQSIAVSGKKKDMDAARVRLTAEGWPSSYRADRSGQTMLHVDPRNRTLDEAWTLTNRFASKEFGLLEAGFSTFPVPGSK
ncbi:MAG: hypothetical protein J7498_03690 [Sphingobium sp.]|nr:hypothetical protein [Sphingobium sp.]